MPRLTAKAKISRKGTVNYEVFAIAATVPADQRDYFRTNKGEYFRKLFEAASHKVNGMTLGAEVDRRINELLDATPKDESVPLHYYVYHVIQSSGLIFRVSDYIISDTRLLL